MVLLIYKDLKEMISIKNTSILLLITIIVSVQIPLIIGEQVCTAVVSSFDPIKIDLQFPKVPGSAQEDNFQVTITSLTSNQIAYQTFVTQDTIFRKNLEIQKNIIHQICISFKPEIDLEKQTTVFIYFTQNEDFFGLIGQVEIPPELAKQQNLKQIYQTSQKLESVSKVIAGHQQKQRVLEDQIVAKDVHKAERILTLSIIQCLVIVLSGVYQICSLRKFLIDKNLY